MRSQALIQDQCDHAAKLHKKMKEGKKKEKMGALEVRPLYMSC